MKIILNTHNLLLETSPFELQRTGRVNVGTITGLEKLRAGIHCKFSKDVEILADLKSH